MLEGDLGDFSIAEILQLLGFTKKTGWLQLHGPRSAGRMVLAEGGLMDVTADVARVGVARRLLGLGYVAPDPIIDILDDAEELPSDRQLLATLVERGHLDAEVSAQICHNHALESLAELLRWTEGSFRFVSDPNAAQGMDTSDVLPAEAMMAEASEGLAGWDELEQRIGAGDQVVSLTSPLPPRDVTIPGAAWGLLMFVDGQRTIDELALLSGRGAYDARTALVELLDQELVALGDDAKVGGAGLAEALTRIARIEAAHHPGAVEVAADADASGGTHGDADAAGEAEDAAEEGVPASAGLSAVVNEEVTAALTPPPPPDNTRSLRTRVRGERLRTDPSIDEDLVSRLIDGVEGM